MSKAYSYLRWSTKRQTDGDSERRQVALRDGYLARHPEWRLAGGTTFRDEGASAHKGEKQKALLAFLDAIAAGTVKPGEALLVESVDRISRKGIDEGYDLCKKILRAGVHIITLSPERDFGPDAIKGLAKGALELQLILERAEEESRMKSARLTAVWEGWRKEVAEGKVLAPPGGRPTWVDWVEWTMCGKRKAGGRMVLNDEKAAALRLIFRWSAEGLGVARIVRRLNDPAAPVPVIGREAMWRPSYVSKLLGDRSVLGEVTYRNADGHRVTVPGFYPAAIEPDEWDRVRLAVAGRRIARKGQRSPGVGREGHHVANLLAGRVYDGADGSLMQLIHSAKSKQGQPFRALVSGAALRKENGASWNSVPYYIVEAAVLRFVGGLVPGDLDGDGERTAARLAVLDGRAADLKGRIEKAKARADKGGDGLEDILELLTKWRGQLKEVEKEAEALRAEKRADVAGALAAAQELIATLRAGGEVDELRSKLKHRIRQVIEGVLVSIWNVDKITRAATLQVKLRSGAVRVIGIAWTRGGRWPGLSAGWVFEGDGQLRDLRGGWSEEVREAVLKAVKAELDTRLALLAVDQARGSDLLGEWLRDATLDGQRPPRRPGRPRKVKAPAAKG